MAGNQHEGFGDDFFEQILAVPPGYGGGGGGGGEVGGVSLPTVLQLGSTGGGGRAAAGGGGGGDGVGGFRGMGGIGSIGMGMMPLGLNLEHGFLRHEDGVVAADSNINNNNNASCSAVSAVSGISERGSIHITSLFPHFGQMQTQQIRPSPPPPQPPPPQLHQPIQSQPTSGPVAAAPPQPIRPRVRARRGQATDPHSIAERLRRERIAERMKALQELVPSCNKTDRAAMLDEIVDYVKFLRLQVKVLSMSRLGAPGAVAQLVADVPFSSPVVEGDGVEGGTQPQPGWEKWSNDGTEQQVAKLMEEDIGAAMQLLQSKALCVMPISLASAIFRAHQPADAVPTMIKPESNAHS